MDEHEICYNYKYSRNPEQQIKIEAELNACSPQKIIKILQNNGLIVAAPEVPEAPKEEPKKNKITTHEEKLKWYKLGLTDTQIAAKLGTSQTTINKWRNVYKLNSNRPAKSYRKYYNMGFNDKEIAQQLKVRSETVAQWRWLHNLQPNKKDRYMEYYAKGYKDGQIAEIVGVSGTAVWRWRQVKGLPVNI